MNETMKPSTRTFHKTVYVVTLVSEGGPIGDFSFNPLADIASSDWIVGDYKVVCNKEITPKKAAKLLIKASSDPEFFGLDDRGNEVSL